MSYFYSFFLHPFPCFWSIFFGIESDSREPRGFQIKFSLRKNPTKFIIHFIRDKSVEIIIWIWNEVSFTDPSVGRIMFISLLQDGTQGLVWIIWCVVDISIENGDHPNKGFVIFSWAWLKLISIVLDIEVLIWEVSHNKKFVLHKGNNLEGPFFGC